MCANKGMKGMSKRLFIGGLAWGTTEEGLKAAFDKYNVLECKIITHRDGDHAGKSKGFGFISVEDGDAALAEMDGTELDGRYLRVNEAHQQKNRHRPTPRGNDRNYPAREVNGNRYPDEDPYVRNHGRRDRGHRRDYY